MVLISLLLSLCAQEVAVAETFPAVGSEAGVVAQEEFRSWLGSAAKAPSLPLHTEYQLHLDLSLMDPVKSVDLVFEGTLVSDLQSSQVLRHHLNGVGVLGGEMRVPVEMNLVLDGENFWFSFSADGLGVIPEGGYYFTGKMSTLQQLYRAGVDSQKHAADLSRAKEETAPIGLGIQATAFLQSLPLEASAIGLPRNVLFYAMAPFSCRSFEVADGAVIARMGLDTQPEALVVEWVEAWDAMWGGMFSMFGDGENKRRASIAYQSLADYAQLTVHCDYATGVLLALKAECNVDAEKLGLGTAEESMKLEAVVQGNFSNPDSLEANLFQAPLPDKQAMNLNAMLELALAEVAQDRKAMQQ